MFVPLAHLCETYASDRPATRRQDARGLHLACEELRAAWIDPRRTRRLRPARWLGVILPRLTVLPGVFRHV